MNPVLRKLSRRDIPRLEIARLLQQHVGDSFDPSHCESALSALTRIRDPTTNAATRVLARMLARQGDPGDTIRQIIEQLRTAEWD